MKLTNPILAALLVAISVGPAAPTPAQGVSPNIVLIVADDLGWSDLGKDPSLPSDHAYNQHLSGYHETPNINALARSGVTYTQAYATPLCSPTRAALMTGLSAARTNFFTVNDESNANNSSPLVAPPNQTEMSPADYTLLPQLLNPAGYVSASIGKWHLGTPGIGNGATDHGFDVARGGNRTGAIHDHFADASGRYRARESENGYIVDLNASPGQYLADAIHDASIEFVDEYKDQPFFLYQPQYSVHNPVQAPAADIAHFNGKPASGGDGDASFAGMLKNLDDNVGQLMSYLETTDDPRRPGNKLIENTIVMFYGDNGSDERWSSNAPLRGNKGTLYEGGYRVPLIVRAPDTIAGSVSDALVQSEDLFATLLDIGGATPPQVTDGISFAGTITGTGGESPRDYAYWHHPSLRRYELPRSVVRDAEGWKLIYDYLDGDPTDGGSYTLYDLSTDLGEQSNQMTKVGGSWKGVNQQADEAFRRLSDRLREWLIDTDATLPTFRSNGQAVPLPPAPVPPPRASAPFYENDFSSDLGGFQGLTGPTDTGNSTWTHDTNTGEYRVDITGSYNNGIAVLQTEEGQVGGPVSEARDFTMTGEFSITPFATSGSNPDQLAVWFLGEGIESSLNNKFRFLVEADGKIYLQEVSGGDFNNLATGAIGAMPNGEESHLTVTVSGYYIDTDADDINDSFELVATIDAGEAGAGTLQAVAGPTGNTDKLHDGDQVAIQFRSRSSGNVMTGSIDSFAINYYEPLAIAGDYNGDGLVDVADYTVWRDSLGRDAYSFAPGSRNAENSGPVNLADYDHWRANYGATTDSSGSIQTPEPGGFLLTLTGVSAGLGCGRTGRSGLTRSH